MSRIAALLISILLAAAGALPAAAQYPDRPIKVLVPYAPGGAVDIVARIVTDRMGHTLGQSFVVENRPGANGIIAIEAMARAAPDGYTIMFGNVNTNTITPILYKKKLNIDYDHAVAPIARVADVPGFVIATAKDFPPKTFAEFVAYAKAHPGDVRYSSVGVGSFPHFDMEILARRAGLSLMHLPNKNGAAGMLNDLVRGDAQTAFINVASSAPLVKAGQLRPLAVITEARMPDYPDVPSLAELGYPGVGTLQWLAMFAPSGVPADVIATLNRAAVEAVESAAVREKFASQNIRSVPTRSPEEARAWLAAELDKWRKITEEVKIELPE